MALVSPQYADRVRETTTSTGTGTVNLGGAVGGFRTFASAFTTGVNVYYCISDGINWEVGWGAFTTGAPATIARTGVLSSTNANSLVNFAAGVKDIFCTFPANTPNTYQVPYNNSVAAAGTTQGTATQLASAFSKITSGTGGVILPVPTVPGQGVTITNVTGTTTYVYPPVTGSIDTMAVNTPAVLYNGGTLSLISSGLGATSVWDSFNDVGEFLANTQTFPFRNRIINGDMQVSQVNGATAVTPTVTDTYPIDQWKVDATQASKLTFQQVVDAPVGLRYSTKITVAAQYTPLATDRFGIYQPIEGQNLIDLGSGTASPATIAISVWIKGSVAGAYACGFNNAGTRSYVGTISVTTTWAKQTVILVADSTGTWPADSTIGGQLYIDLGSGTNFNTTAGTWQAGDFTRTTGTVSFVNQVATSTLSITGAQLEVVPVMATSGTLFEFLPYETQLRRCQRYYEQMLATDAGSLANSWQCIAYGVAAATGIRFQTVKRAIPTGAIYSRNGTINKVSSSVSGLDVGTVVTFNSLSLSGSHVIVDSGSGFTVGTVAYEVFYTVSARL